MQKTNYESLSEAEFEHLLIEVVNQHSVAYLMMQYPAIYDAIKGAMGHKALLLWEQRNIKLPSRY